MGYEFNEWMNTQKKSIESVLNYFLPTLEYAHSNLSEAMRYATLGHGKRIRPLLVIAASELGLADSSAVQQKIAAVEFIHTYSLIHDDLPAMDNDDLRHGKMSCHKAFNEGMALLAGDTLQSLSFEILAQNNHVPESQNLESIRLLARYAGFHGMAGGQALDLLYTADNINLDRLITMHHKKTGALITASVLLGFLSCQDYRTETATNLKKFAEKIGLAFQIIDDVIDCESPTDLLGKTAGKDKKYNKATFISLLGTDSAKQYAHQLVDEAIAIIERYQPHSEHLINIAHYIIQRKF